MASISFYFDEMMPRPVAVQLTRKGFPVTMAVDVNMVNKDDLTGHLVYAAESNLVVATRDKPFAGRAMSIHNHKGVVCWTGNPHDYGGMVRRLAEFAEQHEAETVAGQVFWLKELHFRGCRL